MIYSPTDLGRFMESRYVSWMDRRYLEDPGDLDPDKIDETDEILMARGMAHEEQYLETLKQGDRTVAEILEGDAAISDTIDAM